MPHGCGGAVVVQVRRGACEDGAVAKEGCQGPGDRAQGADPVLDTGRSGAVQDEQDAGKSG